MTYKFNPALDKVKSLVALIFPDGTRQEYSNGQSVTETSSSERYLVNEIRAGDGVVEITLKKPESSPVTN